MQKKILIVFGTRPEAIKMAPLIKAFEKYRKQFKINVCITTQHREMLHQVLDIFDIIPEYDLNIMTEGQDLYDITSQVLLGMKSILKNNKQDLVLVHGDTTTGFASALAAYYQKIPVGHIEAGLRTGNIYSPFPEEMNRKLIGSIAKYNFAPTKTSYGNLLRENVNIKNIIITGNTVIDALYIIINRIENNKKLQLSLNKSIRSKGYYISNKKYILVTAHRRENFGQGFLNICKALSEIAQKNKEIDIVYPVHLNPNVKKIVYKLLKNIKNIYLLYPLGYEQFIYLMHNSYIILTDSGGIQEEAPSLGKPVLVMRETTERPEAVEAGTVKMVGTDSLKIMDEVENLLSNKKEYNKMSESHNPYGDGKASNRIIDFIKNIK